MVSPTDCTMFVGISNLLFVMYNKNLEPRLLKRTPMKLQQNPTMIKLHLHTTKNRSSYKMIIPKNYFSIRKMVYFSGMEQFLDSNIFLHKIKIACKKRLDLLQKKKLPKTLFFR